MTDTDFCHSVTTCNIDLPYLFAQENDSCNWFQAQWILHGKVKFISLNDATPLKSRNKQAACFNSMRNSTTVNTLGTLYAGIHNWWPMKHCCCDDRCWEEAWISGCTKSLHRWLLILFPLWLQLRLKVTHNVGICRRKSSQSLPGVCVVLRRALSTPLIIPTRVRASAGGMHLLLSNS